MLALLVVAAALTQDAAPAAPAEEDSSDGGEMVMDMSMDGPRGAPLPHAREGSGTSWMPDQTPLRGHHWMAGGWMLMLHYNLLAGYDDQWSARGSRRFLSTNWLMGMASHGLLGGELTFRSMLSLEPLTAAGALGTPLLLQTGETYDGVPLHDRQHPHDLFMEVAALYRHALVDDVGISIYAAPSGEPALGPTAFMHRASAMFDPFAPIGHHWQDSTHISFPVVTAGIYASNIQLEGSLFHGREPDEDRWNFDLGPLDSWSLRLSANPMPSLSAEISWGYLHSPEALEPAQSEHRLIGSVQWTQPILAQGLAAVTAVYGRKLEAVTTNSVLLEGQLDLDGADIPFARFEWVEKLGSDLIVPGDPDARYGVTELVLGYARRFELGWPLSPYLGAAVNLDPLPGSLEPLYSTRLPLGAFVFVGLQPGRLDLAHVAMQMGGR